MKQLMTKWGTRLDPAHVLDEYPRPQLRRDSYLCLNGRWTYQMGDKSGEILVPFSPESALSGVGEVLQPGQVLRYERRFTLPEGFVRDRVLLHFGAVDQVCRVRLNGHALGGHEGGYLAFSFDVTDALTAGENVLTVEAEDATEQAPYGRGKQKLVKVKGRMSYLFYTPQSGIWKPVWLESVPAAYVQNVRITPLFDSAQARIDMSLAGHATHMQVTVLDGDKMLWEYEGAPKDSLTAEMPDFMPWTPDVPKLYDVVVRLDEDEVRSYFGMRKLSVEKDASGVLRFCLNGKPYFFNGVLDQGYWPESLMTPPSDEALAEDIVQLKAMGFNTIRKHIKIESDRFYYHCDRLGMIVWQDMPCGGASYWLPFVTYLPNVSAWACRHIPDRFYRLFGRKDADGRAQYAEELTGMIRQLYSHPCIAAWTAFNEGWGQFDARKATALIRREDDTRFINEACGWFDQGGGDMYSIHNYFKPLTVRPQDRVVALTEYGGYAYQAEGHMACEKKVGYKSYATAEAMTADYEKLWHEQLIPAMKDGLSAAIYTQTSDIEEEINGLMSYDRAVVKFPAARLAALHAEAAVAFEEAVR